jgi:hypothetical protein
MCPRLACRGSPDRDAEPRADRKRRTIAQDRKASLIFDFSPAEPRLAPGATEHRPRATFHSCSRFPKLSCASWLETRGALGSSANLSQYPQQSIARTRATDRTVCSRSTPRRPTRSRPKSADGPGHRGQREDYEARRTDSPWTRGDSPGRQSQVHPGPLADPPNLPSSAPCKACSAPARFWMLPRSTHPCVTTNLALSRLPRADLAGPAGGIRRSPVHVATSWPSRCLSLPPDPPHALDAEVLLLERGGRLPSAFAPSAQVLEPSDDRAVQIVTGTVRSFMRFGGKVA